MKRLIIGLLISIASVSCFDAHVINRMEPPVILLAKSTNGSIVLIDRAGHVEPFVSTHTIANSISNSYEVGDTIIH